MPLHSLYLCYFGLREPLVQTQVLPYLRKLAAAGTKLSLLTFEPTTKKWSDEEFVETRTQLAKQGIAWHRLTYHKRPSMIATLFDILAGARLGRRLIRDEGVNVLHARAHVPMAMAMLAARAHTSIVFDVRGLMAEEYRDAGIWSENSPAFRVVKKVERAGLKRANQVVVLTRRMREWITSEKLTAPEKIEVIPCCVDQERFATTGDPDISDTTDRFEIIYAGSLVGLYMVEEMGRLFKAIKERQPNAFLRILSGSPPETGANQLAHAGLSADDFWIGPVPPGEVPSYLRRARIGISFRKATFAQIAASPTKIPEYLAAGLPVVSNAGIGDVDELLTTEKVGVIVREFAEAEYAQTADGVLALVAEPEIRSRCIEVARRFFDLDEVGGRRYREVYSRLEAQQESHSSR
ncbi:MAG TPA: glycosyltransferase [Pyrinomonadaceae bacterium]|jgi:glycosyltransferase involved in cell wall biosynthesis|nr:glycosyltransferase [Pyrinomonadaceae bacterium]